MPSSTASAWASPAPGPTGWRGASRAPSRGPTTARAGPAGCTSSCRRPGRTTPQGRRGPLALRRLRQRRGGRVALPALRAGAVELPLDGLAGALRRLDRRRQLADRHGRPGAGGLRALAPAGVLRRRLHLHLPGSDAGRAGPPLVDRRGAGGGGPLGAALPRAGAGLRGRLPRLRAGRPGRLHPAAPAWVARRGGRQQRRGPGGRQRPLPGPGLRLPGLPPRTGAGEGLGHAAGPPAAGGEAPCGTSRARCGEPRGQARRWGSATSARPRRGVPLRGWPG